MRAGLLAALLGAVALSGCFQLGYLAQAGAGQYRMLRAARPINEALRDPEVSPRIKRLLWRVPEMKAFGQAHGLKPTPNYQRYADLGRPAAVWVVQGCAPLAFEVRRWSFPLVGSVPYLGFFEPGRARAFADRLAAEEGLDTDVRTASAYSTLGFLHDPVLSTMIPEGDEAMGELADTVLHESVHATVYVPGQSAFDESLASFVAGKLAPLWLASAKGVSKAEAEAWSAAEARYQAHVARMHQAWTELDALYRSGRPEAELRAEKARQLAALQAELHLRRPLNNAALAGYRTYDTSGPAFERLLQACGGDLQRFLGAVGSLQERDFDRAQQEDLGPVLERLAARRCPAR